jgi:hypothetical protein
VDDFNQRSQAISKARGEAIKTWEESATKEAEGEAAYRKAKAVALLKYRADGVGIGEAIVLADADAASERLDRDVAGVLKQVSREKIQLLERNAATLKEQSQRELAFIKATGEGS